MSRRAQTLYRGSRVSRSVTEPYWLPHCILFWMYCWYRGVLPGPSISYQNITEIRSKAWFWWVRGPENCEHDSEAMPAKKSFRKFKDLLHLIFNLRMKVHRACKASQLENSVKNLSYCLRNPFYIYDKSLDHIITKQCHQSTYGKEINFVLS